MDNSLANKYEKLFCGDEIAGYMIGERLGIGKSAIVFCALSKAGHKVVVKIFDNELIEKYGERTQKQRIFRERSLINHNIEGLVGIVDGGTYHKKDIKYYYIVMEYIQGLNLKEHILEYGACDEKFAKITFSTLLHVTEQLAKINIVHRDIKPENIMVKDNGVTLMDLGVLKPIGENDLTDMGEGKPFIGTLRYAPPEFLLREETNTTDGWKAVDIYQIGATLHDVIMGYELFKQYSEPYAVLVNAVQNSYPHIERIDYDQDFVHLIRNMLIKDWHTRLSLFSKTDIQKITSDTIDNNMDDLTSQLINKRRMLMSAKTEINLLHEAKENKRLKLNDMNMQIAEILRFCLDELIGQEIIMHYLTPTKSEELPYYQPKIEYVIEGTTFHGFYGVIHLVTLLPKELDNCDIKMIAKIKFGSTKSQNTSNQQNKAHQNVVKSFPTYNFIDIFSGVFNKSYVREKIKQAVLQIIDFAIIKMEPFVNSEIEWIKELAMSSGPRSRAISIPPDVYIDSTVIKLD